MEREFENKVAVVTDGAKGIGAGLYEQSQSESCTAVKGGIAVLTRQRIYYNDFGGRLEE